MGRHLSKGRRDGPQHLRDEDLHQALVESKVSLLYEGLDCGYGKKLSQLRFGHRQPGLLLGLQSGALHSTVG